MQTKRDQLQAHRFIVSRLVSAVLRGDADAVETPTRRFSTASIVGVVLGVLLVGGFAVYGLLVPGHNTAWREPGALVVVRESGTRYVLDGDTLRPVLNLASARLLLGPQSRVVSVSHRSLDGVPRGLPVGIPEAPDSVPAAADLVTLPWAVCAGDPAAPPDGGPPAPTTVLAGVPSQVTTTVGDQAVLVEERSGTVHLLWQDQRHRVAEDAALVALGIETYDPVPVGGSWLAAVPEGPDLAPPELESRGSPGPDLGGRPSWVGQVLTVPTPGSERREYYLVLPDGLSPLPPAQAAMILADPDSRVAYGAGPVVPVEVSADVVSAADEAAAPDWSGLPSVPPAPLTEATHDERRLCVQLPAADDPATPPTPELALVDAAEMPDSPPDDTGDVAVHVPTGTGVLVRSADGPPDGDPHLVDEVGVRYPLVSEDAVRALGLAEAVPVPLPPEVLGLLPRGPRLGVAEAARTVAGEPVGVQAPG